MYCTITRRKKTGCPFSETPCKNLPDDLFRDYLKSGANAFSDPALSFCAVVPRTGVTVFTFAPFIAALNVRSVRPAPDPSCVQKGITVFPDQS